MRIHEIFFAEILFQDPTWDLELPDAPFLDVLVWQRRIDSNESSVPRSRSRYFAGSCSQSHFECIDGPECKRHSVVMIRKLQARKLAPHRGERRAAVLAQIHIAVHAIPLDLAAEPVL